MLFVIALLAVATSVPTPVDRGYADMYNLDFPAAHREFQQWRHDAPDDPMGPVGDAAAYLFSEFERLHVLESEFFTDDHHFSDHEHQLKPDQAAKSAFEAALAEGQKLSATVLSRAPNDENAMLASVFAQGLHADYLALVEHRDLAALSEMKQSRQLAEHLLRSNPQSYDAYLAIGVENYLLGLKAAPVRWLMRFSGAETDKGSGISHLKLTAEHGRYLLPYAKLLLAVAALRDGNRTEARNLLSWLASKFPGNVLYKTELLKLR